MRKLVVVSLLLFSSSVLAKDVDGKWAQADPEKHQFYHDLHSRSKTWCCDISDGRALSDPDWQTQDKPGSSYKVRLDGEWIDVPDSAIIDTPNKYGVPIVWSYRNNPLGGPSITTITCFLPGAQG